DEMSGAVKRRAVHPRRREPERRELLPEHVADRADAWEVMRAAVDVDGFLEEPERGRVAGIDRRGDRAFGGRGCLQRRCGGETQQEQAHPAILLRGASPLGLVYTLTRAPLRRRDPVPPPTRLPRTRRSAVGAKAGASLTRCARSLLLGRGRRG